MSTIVLKMHLVHSASDNIHTAEDSFCNNLDDSLLLYIISFLFPYTERHAGVMYNDIQEKYISKNTSNKGESYRVNNFIFAPYCFIYSANTFFSAEVGDKTNSKQYKARTTEIPFISSIKNVCKGCGKRCRCKPKSYENHR